MTRIVACALVAVAACKGGAQQARGPEAVPVTVAPVEKKDVPLLAAFFEQALRVERR